MNRLLAPVMMLLFSALPGVAAEPQINIVAAENFYGEIAQAIGGERVSVTSVITQPGTDPHDYEPTPSVARAVADADIVVLNGADYDPWMERLIDASQNPDRGVIDVAALIGKKAGDNPHVWYEPHAMTRLADALVDRLVVADPGGATAYREQRTILLGKLAAINEKISSLNARFAGTPVTATEPVFGYMADALGLAMQNEDFQTAIMNETEPSAGAIAAMESSIKEGRVKVLFYNTQVEDPLTQHLAELAKAAGVAVVGVTETQPEGKTFTEWMLDQLDATGNALGAPAT